MNAELRFMQFLVDAERVEFAFTSDDWTETKAMVTAWATENLTGTFHVALARERELGSGIVHIALYCSSPADIALAQARFSKP